MPAQMFPPNQQRSVETAFGHFRAEQGRHIFSGSTIPVSNRSSSKRPSARTYFTQSGMVNIALFETTAGLLLVDCG